MRREFRSMLESAIRVTEQVQLLETQGALKAGVGISRIGNSRSGLAKGLSTRVAVRALEVYDPGTGETKQQFCDRQKMLFDEAKAEF
jgi:hypothetical protein